MSKTRKRSRDSGILKGGNIEFPGSPEDVINLEEEEEMHVSKVPKIAGLKISRLPVTPEYEAGGNPQLPDLTAENVKQAAKHFAALRRIFDSTMTRTPEVTKHLNVLLSRLMLCREALEKQQELKRMGRSKTGSDKSTCVRTSEKSPPQISNPSRLSGKVPETSVSESEGENEVEIFEI